MNNKMDVRAVQDLLYTLCTLDITDIKDADILHHDVYMQYRENRSKHGQ